MGDLLFTRRDMISALQRIAVPVLRKQGFSGSFPHFRRIGSNRIDLLTFQFDKRGGGFVAEAAQCGAEGFTTHWGEDIPPQKVKALHLHPNNRLRIGSSLGQDHWFRYDNHESVNSVAESFLIHLLQAEAWWTQEVN